MYNSLYQIKRTSILKSILVFFMLVIFMHTSAQDRIDIGLYKTTTPVNTVQVKMRPNYSLPNNLSAFCYTIRWTDPTIVISMNYYSPYFISPNDNGVPRAVTIAGVNYYYMVFNAVTSAYNGGQLNPGDEVLISSFSFTGGSCNTMNEFEIINDAWTKAENANVYFEVQGRTKTGIIYKPKVSFNAIAGVPSSNQLICNATTPSDITLNGSNGDIQWQKSTDNSVFTNISGATSATLTSMQMGSLTATTYYRAVITIGSCTATSDVVTVTVSATTNTWTGGSSDWNTPTNWSTGLVPLPCNDVIIPFTGIVNFPVISTTGAICHDLTINPGAQLTLNAGFALSTKGNLLIESSKAQGTGTIVDKNIIGGITTLGTTTVQQFLTGSSALARFPQWYVSSPVVGATSNTFDAAANGNKLFFWTESAHAFTEITDNSTSLETGKGYIARMGVDETVVNFTGTALNSGHIAQNGLTFTGTHNNMSYNLLGNPYASFLNWDDLWNLQSTLLQPTLFTRYADGSLQYYNAVNGASSNTSLNLDTKNLVANGLIAPLQAFWVEVTGETTSGSEGSFYFDNANRSHQPQPVNKLKAPAVQVNDQQLIRLKVTDGIGSDETVILFNEKAKDTYDFWDSHKMFTGIVSEIYTVTGIDKLAINGLNSLKTTNEIPLGFSAVSANNFTLSLSELTNLPTGSTVSLIDNTTQPVTLTDLTANSYNFTSGAVTDDKRFTIIIKAPGVVTQTSNSGLDNVFYTINSNRQITIICNDIVKSDANVGIYNSLGIQILSKTLSGKVTSTEKQLVPGIYIVKVINGTKIISEKIIIK